MLCHVDIWKMHTSTAQTKSDLFASDFKMDSHNDCLTLAHTSSHSNIEEDSTSQPANLPTQADHQCE